MRRVLMLARIATGVFVVTSMALVLPRGMRTATSESDAPAGSPATALEPHRMFTPYAADDAALTFEELSPGEQAVIEAERKREPAETSEARFATLKAMTIERGERTHAEAQASMVGLGSVGDQGVVP